MPPDDDIRNDESTYNEARNEDKQLLMAHGYKPGELPPEDERDLLRDLRAAQDDDEDGSRIGEIGDSQ